MNDDGTMARLPDLVAFAQLHNIRIGTISDLIAYRRRYDNLVRERAVRAVKSEFGGEWMLRVYADEAGGSEHLALTMGDISTDEPVLVRMHAANPLSDMLGLVPGRSHQLAGAMQAIAAEGRGVLVLLRDMDSNLNVEGGVSPQTLRQYGLGAQILGALGIQQMILLTNSPSPKVVGLDGYGLSIAGTRPIPEGDANG